METKPEAVQVTETNEKVADISEDTNRYLWSSRNKGVIELESITLKLNGKEVNITSNDLEEYSKCEDSHLWHFKELENSQQATKLALKKYFETYNN